MVCSIAGGSWRRAFSHPAGLLEFIDHGMEKSSWLGKHFPLTDPIKVLVCTYNRHSYTHTPALQRNPGGRGRNNCLEGGSAAWLGHLAEAGHALWVEIGMGTGTRGPARFN